MNVVDNFGDPDRSPSTRHAARIAHLMLPLAIVSMGVRSVEWFVRLPYWLSIPVAALVTTTFIFGVLHLSIARICLRCMEEVPADAPVRAQQQRWLLWYEHLWRNPKWALAFIAVLFGAPFLRQKLFGDTGGFWLYAPTDIGWFLMVYATWVHHRVSPWCPYCRRWDEGGDHEPSPTPNPSGVKSA